MSAAKPSAPRMDSVDLERVGVILGSIALPTDCISELAEKVIRDEESNIHPLNRSVTGLPAVLLAKAFGLGGTAFTLDAACASSLYAIKLACDELLSGRVDAMLAGGLSRPDSLYTQMGFSQLRALSPSGRCSPFDATADGLVVGEGAGMFILKRLSDAINHRDVIHGVIAGIGLSNDIEGNLLAPASEGQLRAMRAAYQKAGWKPADVDLIECHATGTPIGDRVEFESMTELWKSASSERQCVIGSVKSTVGHLLTGANAAGLMKVLLAFEHARLPPSANFFAPQSGMAMERSPFRILNQSRPWEKRGTDVPRRAAVSGFGFGGINGHLLVEEWLGVPAVSTQPSMPAKSPIAVIRLAGHFGELPLSQIASNRFFAEEPEKPSSFAVREIDVPLGAYAIPPKEMEEMLPQQLLMLNVAREAMQQQKFNPAHTGVILGVDLDPNTTNFHLRWRLTQDPFEGNSDQRMAAIDSVSPPLNANRTLGALASIAASRVARMLRCGGPSFTVSSGETSGLHALDVAADMLRQGEIDCALVGAVDLAVDPRSASFIQGTPGDGAVALVLKRLEDAELDGDQIHALLDEARSPLYIDAPGDWRVDPIDSLIGHCGAAHGLAAVGRACMALSGRVLPGRSSEHVSAKPQYWLNDDATGVRSAKIVIEGLLSSKRSVQLSEYVGTEKGVLPRRLFWLRDDRPTLLLFTAASLADMHTKIDQVSAIAEKESNVGAIASRWWQRSRDHVRGTYRLALVIETKDELQSALTSLAASLEATFDGSSPNGLRVFARKDDAAGEGKIAFVFPGSGNHYADMGRELGLLFPEILDRQQSENRWLRSQYAADEFWSGTSVEAVSPRSALFAQVSYGTLIADLLRSFGVQPDAAIGYSLGESAGLFGLRVWRDRDEMFERLRRSTLFTSDLAHPFNAARQAWLWKDAQPIDWITGVLAAPAELARASIGPNDKAYQLIINTADECVIGGHRPDVERLVEKVGKAFWPVQGVTTAHCEAAAPVRQAYRALHHLPVSPLANTTFYSGASGRAYEVTSDSAADAILGSVLGCIDFPRVIEAAYSDGVRCFIEIGPGASCTRMIGRILQGRRHRALAMPTRQQPALTRLLSLLGELHVLGANLDLAPLFEQESLKLDNRMAFSNKFSQQAKTVGIPVRTLSGMGEAVPSAHQQASSHSQPFPPPCPPPAKPGGGWEESRPSAKPGGGWEEGAPSLSGISGERRGVSPPWVQNHGGLTPRRSPESVGALWEEAAHRPAAQPQGGWEERSPDSRESIEANPTSEPIMVNALRTVGFVEAAQTYVAIAKAHETFLRLTTRTQERMAETIALQSALLSGRSDVADEPLFTAVESRDAVPRALDYEQCREFAAGSIGAVFGSTFAEIDSFPTRVRLPDGPLMLVDRVLSIEGEPHSMTHGRVITEHYVHAERWYLDAGRIPTCVAVEAGQADLLLSAYLGIDLETRGLAVYRLLDASITFHRPLPQVGELIRYDIRINHFFRQGDTYLFRFQFEGSVDGEPLLTMTDGCAGFFTADALASGKGIVQTTLDRRPMPGKHPADWRTLAPMKRETFSAQQIGSLRQGNLAEAFGHEFQGLGLHSPMRLPGGMLHLVDRVVQLEPDGGRFGLGSIRAEADIHPDDWFLTCHFVDDMVMPGTLMYECCLHTLRIFLMRMGWVGEEGELACEPLPGISSRLKCRGQVIASTKVAAYEVVIKELGYGPEPYAIADALMYADGRPIVEMTNMSLRLTGLHREQLERMWRHSEADRCKPRFLTASASWLSLLASLQKHLAIVIQFLITSGKSLVCPDRLISFWIELFE